MCPNDEKWFTKKLIIIILSRFAHFFCRHISSQHDLSQRRNMPTLFPFV